MRVSVGVPDRGELYRGKDEELMRWPRRLRGILAEVRLLKPDILCLQECEDFAGVERGLAGDGYVVWAMGGGKRFCRSLAVVLIMC